LKTALLGLALILLNGCARRYRVEGMIVSIRRDPATLTVSHRAIPGFMPAMTMPFPVEKPSTLESLSPGDRICFDLLIRNNRSRLANISTRRTDPNDEDFIPVAQKKLPLSAPVPDFQLSDHTGASIRLSNLQGRVVAINFIYTRCPLPDVCPRLTSTFAHLQRRFESRTDLALLSITLDPRYDTPEILAAYAASAGARPPAWRMLTGPESDITSIARSFGLLHWAEEGVIVHSSYTAVITRDGRLAALVEGSTYPAAQLADLIAHFLDNGE